MIDLKAIAKKYNIEFYEYDELEKNSGYYACGEIVIATKFDKEEFKVAVFFHELGHHFTRDKEFDSLFLRERASWQTGIEMAKEYNIVFSKEALKFANKCLRYYFFYEYNEIYSKILRRYTNKNLKYLLLCLWKNSFRCFV